MAWSTSPKSAHASAGTQFATAVAGSCEPGSTPGYSSTVHATGTGLNVCARSPGKTGRYRGRLGCSALLLVLGFWHRCLDATQQDYVSRWILAGGAPVSGRPQFPVQRPPLDYRWHRQAGPRAIHTRDCDPRTTGVRVPTSAGSVRSTLASTSRTSTSRTIDGRHRSLREPCAVATSPRRQRTNHLDDLLVAEDLGRTSVTSPATGSAVSWPMKRKVNRLTAYA